MGGTTMTSFPRRASPAPTCRPIEKSAGGTTSIVNRALSRARRRAVEQRQRHAEKEEAEAVAKQRERFGRRDARLERFVAQSMEPTFPVYAPVPAPAPASVPTPPTLLLPPAAAPPDLKLILLEEIGPDAWCRTPPEPQPLPSFASE